MNKNTLQEKRIWVIGGSGLGKSSFVDTTSEYFNLKHVPEAMREAPKSVWEMDFLSTQLYFVMQYISRQFHSACGTIHDRCLLDTMLWGMYPHYNNEPFVDLFKKNNVFVDFLDVFVIAPTPKFSFYKEHKEIWLDDPLRKSCYSNEHLRVYGKPELINDNNILQLARYKSKSIEHHSKKILSKLGINNVISFEKNEFTDDTYYHWQDVAQMKLDNINAGYK